MTVQAQSISRMVNALFTAIAYRERMTPRLSLLSHSPLLLVLLITAVALILPHNARAQTATVDWADAGVASQGSFPTPTTVTGSDGTTATVEFSSQTEGTGSFDPAFAPTFLSYFSGTIGSGVSPLFVSFNNSSYDPRDKITVTIALNRSVRNLRFSLGDIDFGSFADAVEVSYDDDASGAFTNAATNTAFWTLGSSVTRTNDGTVNGWRGTANSDTASANGNINFDFGTQRVQRIRIVYFSYTGTGNPVGQFAGISDLEFDETFADLSLSKILLGSAPAQGGTASWELTVTNSAASDETASAIAVRDTLPAGFNFSSSSGTGSFDAATGDWTVGSLAPGASASLTIQGTIAGAAGTTITNTAEIIASSANDPDSTINNGVTSEDDYAESSFTVAQGSSGGPSELVCPNGTSIFRWGSISWPRGSLNNSYNVGTLGTINFSITNQGAWVPASRYGGTIPGTSATMTGGYGDGGSSLIYHVNRANRAQQSVTTITLPTRITGAQFEVFDIDSSSGFQDRITVYGLLDGVRVNAILTGSSSNNASGDTVLGDGSSSDTQSFGNATITFSDTIDTIIMEYGNGSAAPNDPTNQGIGLHDISLCNPSVASLSVTKVSSVISDPVNGTVNPKAIPGAIVEYVIQVTNTGDGSSDADSVLITDIPSSDTRMCLLGEASGPVTFSENSGSSGLTYAFQNLSSSTDDLEFSNDNGATWLHSPTPDADGCDATISGFRVNPKGSFAPASSVEVRVRFRVQ